MSYAEAHAYEYIIRGLRAELEASRIAHVAARAAHHSAEQDVRRLRVECERNVEQLNRERALRLRAEKAVDAAVDAALAAEVSKRETVQAQSLQVLTELRGLVEQLRQTQEKEERAR